MLYAVLFTIASISWGLTWFVVKKLSSLTDNFHKTQAEVREQSFKIIRYTKETKDLGEVNSAYAKEVDNILNGKLNYIELPEQDPPNSIKAGAIPSAPALPGSGTEKDPGSSIDR